MKKQLTINELQCRLKENKGVSITLDERTSVGMKQFESINFYDYEGLVLDLVLDFVLLPI